VDIEKLTELKDYMTNLPNELLKVQLEILKATQIYGILESFNYKFSKDEMNKKWLIVGGPKEVTQLMEQRKKTLDKDQVKFLDQMKILQEDFKATIDNLERTIQNFH
jgi:dynein heavy chain